MSGCSLTPQERSWPCGTRGDQGCVASFTLADIGSWYMSKGIWGVGFRCRQLTLVEAEGPVERERRERVLVPRAEEQERRHPQRQDRGGVAGQAEVGGNGGGEPNR